MASNRVLQLGLLVARAGLGQMDNSVLQGRQVLPDLRAVLASTEDRVHAVLKDFKDFQVHVA